MFKAAVESNLWHGDCLLSDGFFSFAVVRQIIFFFYIIEANSRRNLTTERIFDTKTS